MANRQLEVHVVKVQYVKATSPEDAAMARAGISLLLRMINKAKATSDKHSNEVSEIDHSRDDDRGDIAQPAKNIDEQKNPSK